MMFPKILLVDDSASDRMIIMKMLSGYDMLEARGGLEAMRLMEEHADIDLVILDLNMPKMDGFQVLTEMKSRAVNKKPRFIILTNYDELDKEKKGLQLGAVDYIRKPIHMDSLNARIGIHVEMLRIQQALEQELHEQTLTFDMIFQQAPIGIAISFSSKPAAEGGEGLIRVNPMYEKITGWKQEELFRLGWAKITHPDDLEEDNRNFIKLQAGEIDSYSMDKRYIRPDGSFVWVRIIVSPISLKDGRLYNHICLVQDITWQKTIEAELMESERAKSVLLSNIPGMAYKCRYDPEWTMEFVSRRCHELTGYPPECLIGNKVLSFNEIIAPEYREGLRDKWKAALSKGQPLRSEYEIITANGERKWVLELGEGVLNNNGVADTLEGIIIDITDRKLVENRLKFNNEHDRWTGLYNRSSLESMLGEDLKNRTAGRKALVNINLSPVQSLTMTYGFHYTQELIKKVANLLRQHCSDNCLLFYTYENRFVFYVKDYQDSEGLLGFCSDVAGTLEPLLSGERIGGGIGVVEIGLDNEENTDKLLIKSLTASEEAIVSHDWDIGICFYDREMGERVLREEEIKREIAQIAMDENDCGLFVQYQPIVELKSGLICGFEALSRLCSESFGLVPPMEFIPIAEKTKLIVPLGWKIIQKALNFLKKISENGHAGIGISINISAIQLLRADFSANLFEIIDQINVKPENITLEVTESVFMSNYQEVNRILGGLKNTGIHIAIDDFGTGYSSLARERDLNVNNLKIDRSFISALMNIEHAEAITSDIISMSHKLGHYVTAEGVEYEQQRQYLLDCGCDRIQGYLVSRPLDEEKAVALLNNQTGVKKGAND